MIANQDIDALLIGALYGELTPADEARLTAHLESHPIDRSALDGLRTTREAVRDSRILAVHLDPPQAISAILLQEAARRAPKVAREPQNNDSWFTRFVRSFAAHPAMAAAAMLVMVVGVGGLMYMRNGDKQFAEDVVPSAERSATITASGNMAAGSGSSATAPSDQQGVGIGAGDSFRVDLADGFNDKNAENRKADAIAPTTGTGARSKDKIEGGIEVHTDTPTVKDLPETVASRDELAKKPMPAKTVSKGSYGGKPIVNDELDEKTIATNTPPKADPRSAPGFATTGTAVAGSGVANGQGQAGNAAPPPPVEQQRANAAETEALLAWAKDKHTKVASLAKAGNCRDAAKIASEIATKAPEYYNQHVTTDRDMKQCLSYINDEREREAEKSNKSRAQKRLDANEPAPSNMK